MADCEKTYSRPLMRKPERPTFWLAAAGPILLGGVILSWVHLPNWTHGSGPPQAGPVPTPEQMRVLEDVREGSESTDEAAFYLLLRLADSRQGPAPITDTEASQLLADPARFRGSRLHLELQVWLIRRFQPANQLSWPRPVYELNCKSLQGQPVTLFLTQAPVAKREDRIVVDGWFYKTLRYRTRAGQMAIQPLLISDAVTPVAAKPTVGFNQSLGVMMASILALGAVYLYVRWQVSRRTARPQRRRRLRPHEQSDHG